MDDNIIYSKLNVNIVIVLDMNSHLFLMWLCWQTLFVFILNKSFAVREIIQEIVHKKDWFKTTQYLRQIYWVQAFTYCNFKAKGASNKPMLSDVLINSGSTCGIAQDGKSS